MPKSIILPRKHEHKKTIRFKHVETGEYLHLAGEGVVSGTTFAWLGTRKQARNLRDKAVQKGQEWLFKAVNSDDHRAA